MSAITEAYTQTHIRTVYVYVPPQCTSVAVYISLCGLAAEDVRGVMLVR